MRLEWCPTGNAVSLLFGGRHLATRAPVGVRTPDGQLTQFPIEWQSDCLVANLGGYGRLTEQFERIGTILRGTLRLEVRTDHPFIVHYLLRRPKGSCVPYFMIPGFLYGTNNLYSATGGNPKFNYGGPVAWPSSSRILTRSDRSTHPGIILVSDGIACLCGVDETMTGASPIRSEDPWAPGAAYTGLVLDSSARDADYFGIQMGYEHSPARYSWTWEDPKTPDCSEYRFGWIKNQSGRNLQTQCYYIAEQASRIPDWGPLLEKYYTLIHRPSSPRSTRADAIQKIGDAIVTRGWNEKRRFFHLSDHPDSQNVGDIAWTGGMQVAYPLLKAGQQTERNHFTEVGIKFADEICDNAINEDAGLLKEEHRAGTWQITGWWGIRENCCNFGDSPLHSAYLNGQAAYYLLKSFQLRPTKRNWLETARIVVETAMRSQAADGSFGIFFDPKTGDAVDYDGFQGCWFAAAAIMLGKITRESRYLLSGRRALDAYHAWHLRGELYGTPMDTHRAVDQEGNLAFIAACSELSENGFDDTLLQMFIDAGNWEFSWKFPYNTFLTNEPLRGLAWSSCGGSITSTYNPSIHPMGNLVASDLYRLSRFTGKETFFNRVRDTCIWGLNCFNRYDGEFGFGLQGEATEQFFYTDGLVLPWNSAWDGGVWHASLPWASACALLSAAADIPERFFT